MGPDQTNTLDHQHKWEDNKIPSFTVLPTSAVNVREQSFLHSSDPEQFIAERGTSLCVPHCHILLQLGGQLILRI